MLSLLFGLISWVDILILLVITAIVIIVRITIFKWKADYLAAKIADELVNSLADQEEIEEDEDSEDYSDEYGCQPMAQN